MKTEALQQTANTIRRQILDMVYHAGSGHLGGSLSAVEILTDLYFSQMNIDPLRPDWELRDRFVLSKGHATPVYYAVLAERGYFPKADLAGFRQIDSYLQGHPDKKHTPGVDMSTGSLGQGLSIAVGMALAGKLRKQDYRVYVLLGDGEIQEGQIWEAMQFAGNQKLDNLTIILDNNHIQSNGTLQEVNSPYPIDAKFRDFGAEVLRVDGHDFTQLEAAFALARGMKGKPTVILAQTVKGKGVSFMENQAAWHGKVPNEAQYQKALEEIQAAGAKNEDHAANERTNVLSDSNSNP